MSYEDLPIERRDTALAAPDAEQRGAVTDVDRRAETVTPATPVVPVVPAVETVTPPRVTRDVRTDRVVRWAPDAFVSAAVGLALLLVGLLAVTRAGLSRPLADPVVTEVGFRHTAVLGLIEVGSGLVLLLSGAARSRTAALTFGALLGIGGFVAAVQTTSFERTLAIESSFAWLVTIAAVIVVLASLVLPRIVHHSTVVDRV